MRTVKRDRITAIEVWCELFGKNQADFKLTDTREINGILAKLPNAERANSAMRCGPYGSQRGFYIR